MAGFVIGCGLLVGCGSTDEAVDLRVHFDAETASRAQAERIEVRVYRVGEPNPFYVERRCVRESGDCLDTEPATWPVELGVTATSGPELAVRVEAQLEGSAGTYASLRATTRVTSGMGRELWLLFEDACVDRSCADGLTCVAGGCTASCYDPADPGGQRPTLPRPCVDALDPCSALHDDSTLALYRFEDDVSMRFRKDVLRNEAIGQVIGGAGEHVEGPPGCGNAFGFPEAVHGVIPDAALWDMERGSIELWIRLPARVPAEEQGILSRDANSTFSPEPGHFSLLRSPDGRILLRVKDALGESHFYCSNEPAPVDRWVHVAVNIGPPSMELYVDGELGLPGEAVFERNLVVCNEPNAAGIAGNSEPWAVGGHMMSSEMGVAVPIGGLLTGGAVDHVRFSRDRRRFGVPR